MIPAAFEYHAPSTIDEATALLAKLGEDAKILSGGQSLIPLMKLRLASPTHLVDINGIPGLSGIREDDGFLRVHLRKGSDRIVGATLVAAHAGDMMSEVTLAMTSRTGLGAIGSTIHPYPTQSEVMKKAADAYNRVRLTPRVKKLFAWWLERSR